MHPSLYGWHFEDVRDLSYYEQGAALLRFLFFLSTALQDVVRSFHAQFSIRTPHSTPTEINMYDSILNNQTLLNRTHSLLSFPFGLVSPDLSVILTTRFPPTLQFFNDYATDEY